MAPHSNTLSWKIPWTEEPDGLQSMVSQESDTTQRLNEIMLSSSIVLSSLGQIFLQYTNRSRLTDHKKPGNWGRVQPRRRKWQPTPILFPGKSHGQRSLAGYSPWGCKESDMMQGLNRQEYSPNQNFVLFYQKNQGTFHMRIHRELLYRRQQRSICYY